MGLQPTAESRYLGETNLRRPAAMLLADIAFARNPIGNSGVVDVSSTRSRLLAVVDGWGSWSNGAESAARAQALITARWQESFPDSLERAADDMQDIARSAPTPDNDPDADGTFHAVVVLINGATIRVAAAGAFPVILFSAARHEHIFKPRTLLDDYLERGTLSPAEIEAFPHKNVFVGPYLAAGRPDSPMTCTSARELLLEESLIVANPRLLDEFLQLDATIQADGVSATALRDRDGRRWAPPVLVVTHRS